jgi:alanine racemase
MAMQIRPTTVTVDLAALRHNLAVIRRLAPGIAVCAVVKADAYGHGLEPVARSLADAGIDWLAVALIEEGVTSRRAGIKTPILVLGAALAGGFEELVAQDLTPALFRAEHLEALARAARHRRYPFHLKLDTGMSRLGLPLCELPSFLESLAHHPELELDGVLTHFANADLADRELNARQLQLFREGLALVRSRGHTPRWHHIANSAAVISYPEAREGLLRPGLMIYGLRPLECAVDLQPAMRWTTRAVHLKTVRPGTRVSYGGRWTAQRDSRIATLPVGYADGYPRALTGKAEVLVRGRRAPVVGTICMDLCMVDVTDVRGVEIGDEVVLMGTQGQESITAHDLARWAGTIPYEIVCGVGPRVPRVYTDGLA